MERDQDTYHPNRNIATERSNRRSSGKPSRNVPTYVQCMSKTVSPERSVGALVRENPAYADVFESVGIDYCCGGDKTLGDACEEASVDVDEVRQRLAEAPTEEGNETEPESLSETVEDIVSEHHQYLREELPALEGLVRKVARVHEESHPELQEVKQEYLDLAEEMKRHIDEEEDELFPVVERLDRGEALTDDERSRLRSAIDEMEEDHDETAERLERLEELTDGYSVPDDGCASYRAMLERLEALEHDTHRHVHKENNVLFTEAEQRLSDV